MNAKKILTIGVTAAMLSSNIAVNTSCTDTARENPLLKESTLPFGAPDFSKIKPSDYLPAIEAAIQQKREEIAKITACEDSATFENTILAYENSGQLLDRVSRVFFALTEADKTPEIGETEKKVLENILSDHRRTVIFVTHRPAVVDYCDQVLRIPQ